MPDVAYPVLIGAAEAAGRAADVGGGAPAALDVVLAGQTGKNRNATVVAALLP